MPGQEQATDVYRSYLEELCLSTSVANNIGCRTVAPRTIPRTGDPRAIDPEHPPSNNCPRTSTPGQAPFGQAPPGQSASDNQPILWFTCTTFEFVFVLTLYIDKNNFSQLIRNCTRKRCINGARLSSVAAVQSLDGAKPNTNTKTNPNHNVAWGVDCPGRLFGVTVNCPGGNCPDTMQR